MKNTRRSMAALMLIAACGVQAQAPIVLDGPGPFHRLDLPVAVHGMAAFADLRDVRVRNAAGQVVPWAWLDGLSEQRVQTTFATQASLFALPLAPVDRSNDRGDDGLLLKLRRDGTLALEPAGRADPARGLAPDGVVQWIVDAGKSRGALVRARFELAPGPMGLFPFTLEGSDDLRRWRSIDDNAQFVRLRHGDERVEQASVELDRIEARFLRLRWKHPDRSPRLVGAWIDSVAQSTQRATTPLVWTAETDPPVCDTDHCDYPMPRGLPLRSLRIALNQPNTLASLRILSMHPTGMPKGPESARKRNVWSALRHGRGHDLRGGASDRSAAKDAQMGATAPGGRMLAEATVFRLDTASGEARSQAIAMDGQAHEVLRLQTGGPIAALGTVPPTLSYGARPPTLVFLAQGRPPFFLTWNADATAPIPAPEALPLTRLMQDLGDGKAPRIDGASVTLTGKVDERIAVAPAAASPTGVEGAPVPAGGSDSNPTWPSNKVWLWAALGIGVLLLGAMAWSLLRAFRPMPPPPAASP